MGLEFGCGGGYEDGCFGHVAMGCFAMGDVQEMVMIVIGCDC